jgi:ATP synthase I chain.
VSEYSARIKLTLLQMALLAAALTPAAYALGRESAVAGLLLGAAASFIYLLLLGNRVRHSSTLPPAKAVASMRAGWFVRLGFVALIVILALRLNHISFFAAVVGLFLLQIVLLLNAAGLVVRAMFSGRRKY